MTEKSSEITLEALDKNLEAAQEFVRNQASLVCSDTTVHLQLDLIVEEIFVNIAHYAYTPQTGTVTINCKVSTEPARLTVSFADSGKPFNPLERADPDVTLSSNERSIGGLGIFLVKKYMTSTAYDYKDGKNIFTITLDF